MIRKLVLCALVLAACAKNEKPAADMAKAPPPPPPPPKALALADVAGTWTQKVMREGSDSVVVTNELVATADTAGWKINFPGRKPEVMHVKVDGDSLMLWAGPYQSVLRKGVMVTTNSVARLKDGKLVGTTVAHYSVKTADSVLKLRTEATRK
jgi:hypothetical protein